jgi:hypothetical protein
LFSTINEFPQLIFENIQRIFKASMNLDVICPRIYFRKCSHGHSKLQNISGEKP